MKMYIVILGVILLVAGIAGAAYYGFVPRTRVYGAIGVAVVGIVIAALGAMMKTVPVGGATGAKSTSGQFTCSKCNAKFNSQQALDQHTKDKHGM